MTAWNEATQRDHNRHDWVGYIVLAVALPVMFLVGDFVLSWVAGLFA